MRRQWEMSFPCISVPQSGFCTGQSPRRAVRQIWLKLTQKLPRDVLHLIVQFGRCIFNGFGVIQEKAYRAAGSVFEQFDRKG